MAPDRARRTASDRREPDGLLVAVCNGQRCAALRERRGEDDVVRASVRESPGGVMLSTGCLGPCHLGSVAVVAHRDGASGTSGPGVWLGGIDHPDRALALASWIRSPGTFSARSVPVLPTSLSDAMITMVAPQAGSEGA